MLAKILFVVSSATVLYVYAGHPLFLYVTAHLRPRKWLQRDVNLSVAVFVSAYNEEKSIAAKITNLLAQDYQGPLSIIIANDASRDRTADIVRSFHDPRLFLASFEENRGKAAMQNQLVPTLVQDIVIFSDATSEWPADTVRRILRNFSDPEVGCVAVDLCFVSKRNGVVEKGQGAYWKYERFLRKYGALVWTNIVASGTTYAIRRSLFEPIRLDIGEDLSNPLCIAMKGSRVVFDTGVVIEERSSASHAKEMRMRTRIAVRNVTGLAEYLRFLSPRYGFAAYQLLVHKYLRVLCWGPMAAAFLTNCILRSVPPFSYLLYLQIAVYLLALIGYINVHQGRASRFTYLFYYFVLLNYSCMVGFINYWKGERRPTWQPDR